MDPRRVSLAPVLLLPIVFALASGCAGPAENYERPLISSGLKERTGYAVGPDADPGENRIPEGVITEDGISESEAVTLALWNNAAFQEAIAQLGLQRADLIQAGLLKNPVFSLMFPWGPKQLEFTAIFPLEDLWLRGERLDAAELDCERVATLLVENGLVLIRDVKAAYASLGLAEQQEALARERATLGASMASIQEARLRAGDLSELDVGLARVKALETKTEAARLARERSLAESRLRGLAGWIEESEPLRFEPDGPSELEVLPDLDELILQAMAARPELRAAELLLEAAGERAGLAKKEFFRLAAILDANGKGSEGFEMGPGLAFDIPVFHQGQGAKARAAAELEIAARHYVTVRDRISLEVRQAHTRCLDVAEGLAAFRTEIVPALEGALQREARAFETGATSPLTVLEGRDRLLLARLQEAQLAGDLGVARAELERQVGRTLGDRSEATNAGLDGTAPNSPPTAPAGVHHEPAD